MGTGILPLDPQLEDHPWMLDIAGERWDESFRSSGAVDIGTTFSGRGGHCGHCGF